MKPNGILIFYHCKANTGYAIGRHEPDFLKMAASLVGDDSRIHLGYTSYESGMPSYVAPEFTNYVRFNTADPAPENLATIGKYIRDNNIDVAFGFDQPVAAPGYAVMREAGIKLLVSYQGAPMSGPNHGLKLLLKKMEVMLRRHKPDHYIFQSRAMADSAVYGRGIPERNVSVIHNAVDTDVFKPDPAFRHYAHDVFGIPKDRKIIFYSGHMEERKGVRIIVEAAKDLVNLRNRRDVHFIFFGNRDGEEEAFYPLYSGTEAEGHITFGGYRDDISCIHRSSYLGVIATTGWDSFTMSSMEMASSGLPLLVSRLQGLVETVDDGATGHLFTPGDHRELADRINELLDRQEVRDDMGQRGRQRVIERFSLKEHIGLLVGTMQKLCATHLK